MSAIRNRTDLVRFVKEYPTLASQDAKKNKKFLVFPDHKRKGQFTLMHYPDGTWTVHGRGDTAPHIYCDQEEQELSGEALYKFLWQHRKGVSEVWNVAH